MLERVQAIAVSIAVGDPTYYKKGWYQNVIPPPFERPGNKSILKSRQVYAQENKGKAGQDPGQKNDWKIVGKHRDESLLDTQFQHLPRHLLYSSYDIWRRSARQNDTFDDELENLIK